MSESDYAYEMDEARGLGESYAAGIQDTWSAGYTVDEVVDLAMAEQHTRVRLGREPEAFRVKWLQSVQYRGSFRDGLRDWLAADFERYQALDD